MTNYARYTERQSFLFTDFGREFAERKFGKNTIERLPKYVRGKHKGMPKAIVVWRKCDQGGWSGRGADYDGPMGFVENRVGKVVLVELFALPSYGSGDAHGMRYAVWNSAGDSWIHPDLQGEGLC
jgi:hypothetical protein